MLSPTKRLMGGGQPLQESNLPAHLRRSTIELPFRGWIRTTNLLRLQYYLRPSNSNSLAAVGFSSRSCNISSWSAVCCRSRERVASMFSRRDAGRRVGIDCPHCCALPSSFSNIVTSPGAYHRPRSWHRTCQPPQHTPSFPLRGSSLRLLSSPRASLDT